MFPEKHESCPVCSEESEWKYDSQRCLKCEKTAASDLVVNTKKAMGFVSKHKGCRECNFMQELENKFIDRSWVATCTYSNLCHFTVDMQSTCTKFLERVK